MPVLFFLFALLSAATPPSEQSTRLSLDAIEQDVAIARDAYERIHPGYDRYTSRGELDAAWDALLDEAEREGGLEVGAFYMKLQRVLARIRCDHTKAELSAAQSKAREGRPLYLPVHWEVREGRAFVLLSGTAELTRGDEIIAIDKESVAELISRFAPLVPVDGFTDHAREAELGSSSEFAAGVIEHFTIETRPVAAKAELEIKTADGKTQVRLVDRVDRNRWMAIAEEAQPVRQSFADAVRLERIGTSIAYLSVDTFVNYRDPVRPDRIYDPVFKAIRKEGQTTLLLDLRRNGGGSEDALQRLFAHLITRRERLVRDVRNATIDLGSARPHLWTWEPRALDPKPRWFRENPDGSYSVRRWLNSAVRKIRPDRWTFKGTIIVLSSRENSSAVSTLLANLQGDPRVTIVGEPTGGSAEGVTANLIYFLTLPNSGIRTRLPAQRVYNDVQSFVPGMGVEPDVAVRVRAEDVRAGRDPVYEAAIELAQRSG